jgi:hypothetical protein
MVVDWTHGTSFSKNWPFPNRTQNPLQKQIALNLMYTKYHCLPFFHLATTCLAKLAIFSPSNYLLGKIGHFFT